MILHGKLLKMLIRANQHVCSGHAQYATLIFRKKRASAVTVAFSGSTLNAPVYKDYQELCIGIVRNAMEPKRFDFFTIVFVYIV